jgi:oligoribonuclease (3'-5' exoribonuclease)
MVIQLLALCGCAGAEKCIVHGQQQGLAAPAEMRLQTHLENGMSQRVHADVLSQAARSSTNSVCHCMSSSA